MNVFHHTTTDISITKGKNKQKERTTNSEIDMFFKLDILDSVERVKIFKV